MMSSTNTTTITTTPTTSSPSEVVIVKQVKNEQATRQDMTMALTLGSDGVGVTPQTNGVTDARVNIDIQSQPVGVTDNNTTTTKTQREELNQQYSSSLGRGSSTQAREDTADTTQHQINPSYLLDEKKSVIDSQPQPSSSSVSNSETSIANFEGESETSGPLPKFRVEGSGAGDSSVTVGVGIGVVADCCNGVGSGGSSSQPNSEDMKLSLVSWYSEPGEERVLTTSTSSCCDDGVDGGSGGLVRQTHSLTNSLISKNGCSEEKENQTPEPLPTCPSENGLLPTDPELGGSRESVTTLQGDEGGNNNNNNDKNNTLSSSPSSSPAIIPTTKMQSQNHVKLLENGFNKNCLNSAPQAANNLHKKSHHVISCDSLTRIGRKPECSKCNRRSKSGHCTTTTPTNSCTSTTTTPTTGGRFMNRSQASRRLMPSTKSSSELKKPIKSILKGGDSNSRSGSGSDNNKSSVDSLIGSENRCKMGANYPPSTPLRHPGSGGAVPISRSEGTSTRAKFNLNHEIFSGNSSSTYCPANSSSEEKIASKLRRIEKYATLRFRKGGGGRVKPAVMMMDLGSDPNIGGQQENGSKVSTPTTTGQGQGIDLMTKSMSYLEKGGGSGDHTSLPFYPGNTNGNSTTCLKRQGSLRSKKGASPQWEPCTTRTTALRMQKMQEAKAKQGGMTHSSTTAAGGTTSGGGSSVHTGSTHSGSGESIHHVVSHGQSHSAPSTKTPSSGEKHRVFAKLSSAFGQTASSNQKRLRQEKSVQTDFIPMPTSGGGDHHHSSYASHGSVGSSNATSMSPIPDVDAAANLIDQVRELEKLANRYRSSALRFQSEYEKSEAKKSELTKQLQEAQLESSEMIEFLQAEKSTLAESLTEIETEAKKLRDQSDLSETRMEILSRLAEGHKAEALQANDLMHRLESRAKAFVGSMSNQISEGKNSILMTRQKVDSLSESLMKAYNISKDVLHSHADDSETTQASVGHEGITSSSRFYPLIDSLAKAFPTLADSLLNGIELCDAVDKKTENETSSKVVLDAVVGVPDSNAQTQSSQITSDKDVDIDKEQAGKDHEDIGLDQMKLSQLISSYPDTNDETYLSREVLELEAAIARLLLVVRLIVVQCNKQVSNVATSILECLHGTDVNSPSFKVQEAFVHQGLFKNENICIPKNNYSVENEASSSCTENGHDNQSP